MYQTKTDIVNDWPKSSKFLRALIDESKHWSNGEWVDNPNTFLFQIGYTRQEAIDKLGDYVEPPAPPIPQPPDVKPELLQQINQEVNRYIIQYYDSGTQDSFIAIYVLPNTSQEVKTSLESVWAWIQSIMQYYYIQKAQIESDIITSASWDFTQFDATKPPVTLASLMA